jgi:hypothetical protein
LSVIESAKVPVEQSRADAPDENNDVADSAYYGNTASALFEISNTYVLKSGSLDLSELMLGELTAGIVAASIDVNTENTKHPTIKVSGKMGLQTIIAPTGKTNKFALPAITINGMKQAQPMGFTVGAGGRLTSCKLSAKVELAEETDGEGEPIAHGVSGGTGTVEGAFVWISAQPTWTLTLAGLTQIKAPNGAEEPQAAHHTATASAGFTLTRGVAA